MRDFAIHSTRSWLHSQATQSLPPSVETKRLCLVLSVQSLQFFTVLGHLKRLHLVRILLLTAQITTDFVYLLWDDLTLKSS